VSDELGTMLHDIDYGAADGRNTPRFFQARLDGGVLRVPPWQGKEVGHAAAEAP
jgi:CRISPR-associated protein Cas5d